MKRIEFGELRIGEQSRKNKRTRAKVERTF